MLSLFFVVVALKKFYCGCFVVFVTVGGGGGGGGGGGWLLFRFLNGYASCPCISLVRKEVRLSQGERHPRPHRQYHHYLLSSPFDCFSTLRQNYNMRVEERDRSGWGGGGMDRNRSSIQQSNN